MNARAVPFLNQNRALSACTNDILLPFARTPIPTGDARPRAGRQPGRGSERGPRRARLPGRSRLPDRAVLQAGPAQLRGPRRREPDLGRQRQVLPRELQARQRRDPVPHRVEHDQRGALRAARPRRRALAPGAAGLPAQRARRLPQAQLPPGLPVRGVGHARPAGRRGGHDHRGRGAPEHPRRRTSAASPTQTSRSRRSAICSPALPLAGAASTEEDALERRVVRADRALGSARGRSTPTCAGSSRSSRAGGAGDEQGSRGGEGGAE